MRPGAGGRSVLALSAAAAVLCSFTLLDPLFSHSRWWLGPALGVGAVAAVGVAAQWLPVPRALLPPLQALALLAAVTGYYAPGTALVGVLPTPASIREVIGLLLAGLELIRADTAPLPVTPALSLLVALGMGGLALLLHLVSVTLRAAGLAGIALLALVFVPLTVHHEGVGWGAFTLTALGFLLLLGVESVLRTAEWGVRTLPDRWRPAARGAAPADALRQALGASWIAGATLALALFVPPLVPGLASDAVFELASGVRASDQTVTTVNPLASLRHDLTSRSDRRILEYRTTGKDPGYLRTHVLSSFDGQDWTMSPVQASQRNRVDDTLPPPPGATAAPEAGEATLEITVSANIQRMDFLPLPYPSSSVRVSGDWYVDPDTLMVFSPRGEAGGLTYQVVHSPPVPSPGQLARSGASGPASVDRRYLDPLPVSAEVARLTESIVTDATTPHERAVALQEWFTGGGFEYDLRPPKVPDGADPLAHFLLDSRTGYCQHFSAAMAVMARHAGIPSRVAVGYTAGEPVGEGRWVVTERDAHAWPELYFEGQGWLRFEPTPASRQGQPSASVPAYAAAAPSQAPAADNRADAPATGGSAAPERTPQESGEAASPDGGDAAAPVTEDPAGGGGARTFAGVAAAAAVLLLVPAVARRSVRRFRWGRARSAPDRARTAWLELRDDLRDLGAAWNPAESPRAAGRRLEAEHRLPEHACAALRRIVAAEEAARYAPEPLPALGLGSDSRAVRLALAAAHPPRRRVLALLLPRSLAALAAAAIRSRHPSTAP